METFNDLEIDERLISALEKQDIISPTYIQKMLIPSFLKGSDIIGSAKTGTGKTLSYLLPMFMEVDLKLSSTQFIVLAPTYELASQIYRQSKLLEENSNMGVKSALIIGSAGITRQIERLKEKPQIIIGSGGRILDLIKRRKISAHTVKAIVVDEADRMLDDQNIENLKAVIKTTLKERQLIFVSASFPKKALSRCRELMVEPIIIGKEEAGGLPNTIKNYYIVCDKRKRVSEIRRLISGIKPNKALIFINSPDKIEEIVAKLCYHGLKAVGIYGEAKKEERRLAIDALPLGRANILLATDIGARGLDIPDIDVVISLDISEDPVQYLHRAGRTGRQNKEGVVISLISPSERKWIKKYESAFNVKFTEKEMSYGSLIDKKVKNIKN